MLRRHRTVDCCLNVLQRNQMLAVIVEHITFAEASSHRLLFSYIHYMCVLQMRQTADCSLPQTAPSQRHSRGRLAVGRWHLNTSPPSVWRVGRESWKLCLCQGTWKLCLCQGTWKLCLCQGTKAVSVSRYVKAVSVSRYESCVCVKVPNSNSNN